MIDIFLLSVIVFPLISKTGVMTKDFEINAVYQENSKSNHYNHVGKIKKKLEIL